MDGVSNNMGAGIGIVLITPEGSIIKQILPSAPRPPTTKSSMK